MLNSSSASLSTLRPVIVRVLRWGVLACLIFGILIRFVNLDQKPYWLDEAFTSLHLSGYSDRQVIERSLEGQVITTQDLLAYQYPRSPKTAWDTVTRIADNAPELPPLYFVLLRGWTQIGGESLTTLRSFSAVLSVLAFPALYWWVQELFATAMVSWVAIALMAVSPLWLLYAQEARPYSLWILLILCAHAALLRAQRTGQRRHWGLYALTMTAAFYTHLLTGLVMAGHTVYCLMQEKWRFTRSVRAYCVSAIVAIVAFFPWVWICLIAPRLWPTGPTLKYTMASLHWTGLIRGLLRGVSLIGVDFSLNETSSPIALAGFGVLIGAWFIVLGYAAGWVGRTAPKQAVQFLGCAIAVPTLIIFASDLLLQANRSTVIRYFIPTHLAWQMVVAYFLTHRLETARYRRWWRLALVAVLSVGMLSCLWYSQMPSWWHKSQTESYACVATQVNASDRPLILSDTFFVKLLSLSHYLAPDVQFQVFHESRHFDRMTLGNGRSIYAYQPSPALTEFLQRSQAQTQSVCGDTLVKVIPGKS